MTQQFTFVCDRCGRRVTGDRERIPADWVTLTTDDDRQFDLCAKDRDAFRMFMGDKPITNRRKR